MITKEKVKFAKWFENTFSTEIIRVFNFIQSVPQPVYEHSDMLASSNNVIIIE